ncbi:unnamed protein product [Caenorhabditis brenneri]
MCKLHLAFGKYSIEIENLRLKSLGNPLLGIVHREEVTPFRGTIRLSVETAKTNKHYYAKYGKDLTLKQYLYVKHGIVLKNPEARLVYFSVVEGDRRLASASPLIRELPNAVDEANPKK